MVADSKMVTVAGDIIIIIIIIITYLVFHKFIDRRHIGNVFLDFFQIS